MLFEPDDHVNGIFTKAGKPSVYHIWLANANDQRTPWELVCDELPELYIRSYAAWKLQGKDVSGLPKPKLEKTP